MKRSHHGRSCLCIKWQSSRTASRSLPHNATSRTPIVASWSSGCLESASRRQRRCWQIAAISPNRTSNTFSSETSTPTSLLVAWGLPPHCPRRRPPPRSASRSPSCEAVPPSGRGESNRKAVFRNLDRIAASGLIFRTVRSHYVNSPGLVSRASPRTVDAGPSMPYG